MGNVLVTFPIHHSKKRQIDFAYGAVGKVWA